MLAGPSSGRTTSARSGDWVSVEVGAALLPRKSVYQPGWSTNTSAVIATSIRSRLPTRFMRQQSHARVARGNRKVATRSDLTRDQAWFDFWSQAILDQWGSSI